MEAASEHLAPIIEDAPKLPVWPVVANHIFNVPLLFGGLWLSCKGSGSLQELDTLQGLRLMTRGSSHP
eukprot:729883-Amphidinium_carterae.1